MKCERSMQAADSLKQSLSVSLQRSVELAQEKGSSVWLTSLPIHELGFALHKRAFQDALALRYNWQPLQAPHVCGCGTKFSIEHSLSCPKGGFPSIWHNEIRDLTANLLTEVCNDVCNEPELLPLMVRCSLALPHTLRMVQDWILLLTGSGAVDLNVPSLMCKFLMLMLPLIDTPIVTESTSWKRSGTMNSEWERLLPLPLMFCQQLVVWPMKQQCSTRGLPPAWPPNGINPIAEQCPGFDADLLFPFFDQQFSVSGVLTPAVDTQPCFRLHQWTWSYLNLNLFSSLCCPFFYNYI